MNIRYSNMTYLILILISDDGLIKNIETPHIDRKLEPNYQGPANTLNFYFHNLLSQYRRGLSVLSQSVKSMPYEM